MRESDYINATNIAKVRAAYDILRSIHEDEKNITTEESVHVRRCLNAWQARLERAISPETRNENKEPWRAEWPNP